MSLLKDKNILIMGVRNKWSIAWGIAKKAQKEGANIILSYYGEREKVRLEKLMLDLDHSTCIKCDISSDEDIEVMFEKLKSEYKVLDGIVHSIAHAYSKDLENDYIYTSREGFSHALDVSAYSLVAVCRRAKDLLIDGGSIITLSYMGSEKVFPGYNVMGVAKAALETSVKYLANDLGNNKIRINALSAGPLKTMSGKGINGFNKIIENCEMRAPLKKNVTQDDIGNTAVYLLSYLSSGVTGEVLHVDCGFNIMGI